MSNMNGNGMKRRQFLRNSALSVLGAGVVGSTALAAEQKKEASTTPKISEYRTLGRTGFKVSDISSGGPQNVGVLNALLDAGVNYIDTAESYSNGQSEKITGEALKNRDRKKTFITTKLGLKDTDTKESILSRSRKCLERMQIDYVDCMMIHSPARIESIKNEHFHAAMKQLKTEGKVRFVGVSNHGPQWKEDVDTMEQVCLAAAADGRFDVMLFVYNFIQNGDGERIIKACKEKNIGVTLMKTNPVGGYLNIKNEMEALKKENKPIPEYFPRIMKKLKAKADIAEEYAKKHNLKNPSEIRDAAIKFVLTNPDVQTVTISLDNFDDVDHYLKLSGQTVSSEEKQKLAMFKSGCSSLYCRHACGICESSCPAKVPVNTIMRYNHYFEAQGREKHALEKYAGITVNRADQCANCSGHCESVCPYGVPVQGLLSLAHNRLTLS